MLYGGCLWNGFICGGEMGCLIFLDGIFDICWVLKLGCGCEILWCVIFVLVR